MGQVIGEMGRWQVQNIAVVFLVGIPGLAHIYSSAFVAAKTDYWCMDDPERLNSQVERGKLINLFYYFYKKIDCIRNA